MFDDSGLRIGFVLNGTTTYYYRFNLQGDVTGIYDTSGNLIAEYVYDAWGAPVSVTGSDLTLANLNPIRYRGYYYDAETGLYYVSSRYYDPEIGRWINADSVVAGIGENLLGYNMFAYCFNNPVNMEDETGAWPRWITATVAAVVSVVSTVVSAPIVAAATTVAVVSSVVNHVINYNNKKKINKEIKDTYTKDEAKEEIDSILNQYSEESVVNFDAYDGTSVEILNSNCVNSRYDRQKICAIIEKTEVTKREFDNMSSEWLLHNMAMAIPSSYISNSAVSASLDYHGDKHLIIVFLTRTFEVMGLE